jgi:hypothetical protein
MAPLLEPLRIPGRNAIVVRPVIPGHRLAGLAPVVRFAENLPYIKQGGCLLRLHQSLQVGVAERVEFRLDIALPQKAVESVREESPGCDGPRTECISVLGIEPPLTQDVRQRAPAGEEAVLHFVLGFAVGMGGRIVPLLGDAEQEMPRAALVGQLNARRQAFAWRRQVKRTARWTPSMRRSKRALKAVSSMCQSSPAGRKPR